MVEEVRQQDLFDLTEGGSRAMTTNSEHVPRFQGDGRHTLGEAIPTTAPAADGARVAVAPHRPVVDAAGVAAVIPGRSTVGGSGLQYDGVGHLHMRATEDMNPVREAPRPPHLAEWAIPAPPLSTPVPVDAAGHHPVQASPVPASPLAKSASTSVPNLASSPPTSPSPGDARRPVVPPLTGGGLGLESPRQSDPHLLAHAKRRTGYLQKKGGGIRRSNWRRRWFVLERGRCSYYKDEAAAHNGDAARNSFSVQGIGVGRVLDGKHQHMFAAATRARTFYVRGSSDSDVERWIRWMTDHGAVDVDHVIPSGTPRRRAFASLPPQDFVWPGVRYETELFVLPDTFDVELAVSRTFDLPPSPRASAMAARSEPVFRSATQGSGGAKVFEPGSAEHHRATVQIDESPVVQVGAPSTHSPEDDAPREKDAHDDDDDHHHHGGGAGGGWR